MKNISLKKFAAMRDKLVSEKAELESRLAELNKVLGVGAAPAPAPRRGRPPKAAAVPAPATKPAKKGGWKRLKNPMSLREAVLKVTAKGGLTKAEIVKEVQKLGYQFASQNPINRLGVLLYGKNPKFKNENGRFSPI